MRETVETQRIKIQEGRKEEDGERFITLTPEVPETPPPLESGEAKKTGEHLSEMEFLEDISYSEQRIMDELADLEFNKMGIYDKKDRIQYPYQEDGTWLVDSRMPKTVRGIFSDALAHEAKINPDLRDYDTRVSIRLVSPEQDVQYTNRERAAHFDAHNRPSVSAYIVTSAPGTIQYLPENPSTRPAADINHYQYEKPAEEWYKEEGSSEGLRAASILPMKLYHFDVDTLHSMPWQSVAVNESKKRFSIQVHFIRKLTV